MTKAEKAQRLMDEGGVEIAHTTFHSTLALVQGERGPYTTTIYADGHYFCTCDWGAYHSYTDDLCVHALALRLVVADEAAAVSPAE